MASDKDDTSITQFAPCKIAITPQQRRKEEELLMKFDDYDIPSRAPRYKIIGVPNG